MELETKTFVSHIIFSAVNCQATVYTDTVTTNKETGNVLNTNTSIVTYKRAGKYTTTDINGNEVELEFPEQDISGEPEFIQNLIRHYWDTYEGNVA